MNKNKKIAMAVVSTVMAGTMALAFTACGDPDSGPKGPSSSSGYTGADLLKQKDEWDVVNDETGDINYTTAYNRTGVTLNLGIGHNSSATSTTFKTIGGSVKLPDGKTYEDDNLKPAWAQMGKELNITFNDVYGASDQYQTSSNIKNMLANNKYDGTDLFTTDLSQAVNYAASGTSILNLGDYLDYMPHFNAFLNANPVVYLSLLQDGMVTSGANAGENKIIYIAPYFDGNDDIERYCIMRQDWSEKILNGDTDLSNTVAWSGSTSVTSYMGTTGNYEIECLTADGKDKFTLVKDYSAVVASGSSFLSTYQTVVGSAYSGTSGNIVDIMNTAIGAKSSITGAELAKLYRAYIDVCYHKKGETTGYYTSANRANVFNGYDACWDVDDLVAILRIAKASGTALSSATVRGIAPRDGSNDRTPDMVRLAAQLYGVRGADSRYEYTYIDKDGALQDARNDLAFYNALENFHQLKAEGLVADYSAKGDFANASGYSEGNYETFFMYDYSQTQTLNGFYAEDENLTKVHTPDGYKFAPVLTPVSKWDVDGDGTNTDIMRFTESWRATKTSGLALNGALANTGNEDKLKAAIQFVDYLYSADGQIISTYGPMASDADSTDGFWYNAKASDAEVNAGHYFRYHGTNYSGTEYKGAYTPTVTEKTYNSFKGLAVNGTNIADTNLSGGVLSFTSYARMVIGSTLPVGVKDQSFENQLTSKMGQEGAGRVGTALAAGVIKGMTLKMDSDNWWYVCMPTGLPNSSDYVESVLNNSSQQNLRWASGDNKTDKKKEYSIYHEVILNGSNSVYTEKELNVAYTSMSDLLAKMQEMGSQLRENTLRLGWNRAKNYWTYLSSLTEE